MQALGRRLEGRDGTGNAGCRDCGQRHEADFTALYPDEMGLLHGEDRDEWPSEIYRAEEVQADKKVRDQLKAVGGSRALATCRCAWRRRSTRSPPTRTQRGAPTGHSLPVREVRLSAGAGIRGRSDLR